jgi:hypothetical protein
MDDPASASTVLGPGGILGQSLSLTVGDAVGLVVLLLLLAGNAFQLHQQRVYSKTVHNGLGSTFNSIGWLLARCMNRTGELNNRIKTADRYVLESTALREFRDYSLETEFMLRVLHEQLVGVATTLNAKDKRWQAGQFGHTPQQIERIEERLRSQAEASR